MATLGEEIVPGRTIVSWSRRSKAQHAKEGVVPMRGVVLSLLSSDGDLLWVGTMKARGGVGLSRHKLQRQDVRVEGQTLLAVVEDPETRKCAWRAL